MERNRFVSLIGVLALVAAACAAPAATTTPATPTPAAATATPAAATPTPAPPTIDPGTPAPPETAPPATEPPVANACEGATINFELSFIPNVQHAGFLVAAEQGYYAEEGLTVNMLPASQTGVTQDVADGTADMGQVDYVDIVEARVAGVPIKAVAQIYKDPFFFWYTNADSGIETVADWAGHTLGAIQVGDYPERDAMMLAAGLDPTTDITVLEQDFGTESFIAGDVEIGEGVVFYHPAYLIGVDEKNWPDDFNVFYPAELGADFASQTIAATDEYIAANGPVITCFLRASIRGWQDTFNDPAAAVTDTMVYVPPGAIPEPHQQGAIHSVLPIVGSGADDTTLLMPTPDEYQATVDQLLELGYLETAVPIADTFDSGPYDAIGAP